MRGKRSLSTQKYWQKQFRIKKKNRKEKWEEEAVIKRWWEHAVNYHADVAADAKEKIDGGH